MYIRRLTSTLALLVGLTACQSPQTTQDDDRLKVATTIAPIASLVEELAGSDVETFVLLPQGNTPESYEPTPIDLAKLADCDLYLYVGELGFERVWVERIRELYPRLTLVRLDEGLYHDHEGHADNGHSHDPHTWTSLRGLHHIAQRIALSLQTARPELAPHLDSTSRGLSARLENYDRLRRAQLDSMASRPRGFVIYHPSLTDYATELPGVEQLVIEQEGKEPSARSLRQLITRARELGVGTVFIQQEFNPELTETIARELGAHTYVINPLGADWWGELRRIDSVLLTPSTKL